MKKVTFKDVIIDFIGLTLVGVVAAVVLVLLVGFSSSAAENTYTCGYTYLQTPESGGQYYRHYDVTLSSQYPIFFINEKGSNSETYKVGTFDGKSAEIWSTKTVNVQSYYMATYQSSNGNLHSETTEWTGDVNGSVTTIVVNTAKGETFNANGYVFDSLDSATAYYLTGDTSGWINKPEIDTEQLFLTGFECDDSICASWTGVSVPEGYSAEDVTVKVSCNYFIMLEKGEEYQEFSNPSTVTIPASEQRFERPLAEYFENNPYDGRCVLYVYFTPCLMGSEGTPICVSFDENKKMEMINVPSGSIEQVLSSDCYFLNPNASSEFHNWGDSFIYFRWTGVAVPDNVNYISSDILVELYCHDGLGNWHWEPYISNEYNFNSMKIDFNLTELQSFAESAGCHFGVIGAQGNFDGEKIRIIPTYKTGSQYVKGKVCEITLGRLGGIKKIEQLESDGTFTDLDPSYDPIDGVINDVTGSSDGSIDVSDIDAVTIKFFEMLKTLIHACGQFPSLVAGVFAFLPSYFNYMLVVGLGMIILLRLLGR